MPGTRRPFRFGVVGESIRRLEESLRILKGLLAEPCLTFRG